VTCALGGLVQTSSANIRKYLDSSSPQLSLYMGWLRLVGSLKLQVSFAEYSLFYRALLQKRRIVLRSLLIVATLYHIISYGVATISRVLRIIGLFRRIQSVLQGSFAKETYNFTPYHILISDLWFLI